MRFLAAVLTVALLFGAVGVVTVSVTQADHAAVTAPTASVDWAGDGDTVVSHAGRPQVRLRESREVEVVAVVRVAAVRQHVPSFLLPLRL
jgi:hypothetical protein